MIRPEPSEPRFLRSRGFAGLVVFALTFATAGVSVLGNRQLDHLAALTDEWYYLGANLNATGTLGYVDTPIVLRPPGYPVFLAAALRVLSGTPRQVTQAYMDRAAPAVYLAQAFTLAVAAGLLHAWLSRFLSPAVALGTALAFGCNPYCVVLVGLFHYDVLHMAAIIAGCLMLGLAFDAEARRRGHLIAAAGLVWGAASLVRPLTLVLPAFVLAALLLRSRRPWRALADTARFSLALALVVAPWTLRNYRVTGDVIPVNRQAWAVLWGSTVKVLGIHPNHYNWYQLGGPLTAVFSRVTGEREYSYPAFLYHHEELEAAFRAEALRNLRERPEVYLRNVAAGVLSLNLHVNGVLIKAFQYLQRPGAALQTRWFEVGDAQGFESSSLSDAFSAWFYLLTGLAFGGVAVAVRRREGVLLPAAAVYACLCLAHALFLVDLLYYYVKVPFVFALAGYFVDRLRRRCEGRPAARRLDAAVAVLLLGPALAMTLLLL